MRRRRVAHEVRELSSEEQAELERVSWSSALPKQGRIGRTNDNGASALVKRFNADGLDSRHGGGNHTCLSADYAQTV